MRWVVLTDDWPPAAGGVATWSHRVVTGLAAAGHVVGVFARARPVLAPVPGVRVRGVRGPSFGRHGGAWLAAAAAGALRRADAVLATTWPVATHLAGVLPRRVPLHVVAHGSDVTRPPRSRRGFRRAWGRAQQRWAVSEYLADALAHRDVSTAVLPAPVEPAPAPVSAAGTWVMAGRATPLKGGDRFVRIVAAAGADGIALGAGPELGAWRALAAELGARVAFPGWVPRDRARAVLAEAALVALLPRTHPDGSGAEGLGLALIEAAALGVPTVGCATGGVPEAVGPGLVLPDPDDPAVSAEAIRAWWTPERGVEAQAWARAHHGTERVVRALVGAT